MIVGVSTSIFSSLIGSPNLRAYRLVPLSRKVDAAWVQLAITALNMGVSAKEILDATRDEYRMEYVTVPSKYEREIADWTAIQEQSTSAIHRIVHKAIESVREEMQDWSDREERERIL